MGWGGGGGGRGLWRCFSLSSIFLTRNLAVRLTTICVFGRGKNYRFVTVLPTFQLTGGNYITLAASISDTFGNTLSPVQCSFVCFGTCVTCHVCHVCQTDESCTFQNGGAQSEHALLGEGNCGISTE